MCTSYMQVLHHFYITHLSIHRFQYLQGSWNQLLKDTEGQLYKLTQRRVKTLCESPSLAWRACFRRESTVIGQQPTLPATGRMRALFMPEGTNHTHVTKIYLLHIINLPHLGASPPEFWLILLLEKTYKREISRTNCPCCYSYSYVDGWCRSPLGGQGSEPLVFMTFSAHGCFPFPLSINIEQWSIKRHPVNHLVDKHSSLSPIV